MRSTNNCSYLSRRHYPIVRGKRAALKRAMIALMWVSFIAALSVLCVTSGLGQSPRDGCCKFALARYDMYGRLDPDFDRDGKVLTTFNSASFASAEAMVLDRRYRRVVVGTVYMGFDG